MLLQSKSESSDRFEFVQRKDTFTSPHIFGQLVVQHHYKYLERKKKKSKELLVHLSLAGELLWFYKPNFDHKVTFVFWAGDECDLCSLV